MSARADYLALCAESGVVPDRPRCRRGSRIGDPPKVERDRNFIARLMFMARTIERRSWAARAERGRKGARGGVLGKPAVRLLEILLYVARTQEGRLLISYDALARLACMSRRAVVDAMKILERMGFVSIHRRAKRIETEFGVKVVQDANAYSYHFPRGLGAIAWSIYGGRSECTNCPDLEPTSFQEEEQREREGVAHTSNRWERLSDAAIMAIGRRLGGTGGR